MPKTRDAKSLQGETADESDVLGIRGALVRDAEITLVPLDVCMACKCNGLGRTGGDCDDVVRFCALLEHGDCARLLDPKQFDTAVEVGVEEPESAGVAKMLKC